MKYLRGDYTIFFTQENNTLIQYKKTIKISLTLLNLITI